MTITLDAQPLAGGIGVELDIDLSRQMTVDEQQVVVDLFLSHHLLLIRQPGLTHEEQCRFAGIFGRLLPVGTDNAMEQYVSNTRPDGTLGTAELSWHSDTSF